MNTVVHLNVGITAEPNPGILILVNTVDGEETVALKARLTAEQAQHLSELLIEAVTSVVSDEGIAE